MTSPTLPSKEKKQRKTNWLVLVILGLLVFNCLIFGYMFWQRQNQPKVVVSNPPNMVEEIGQPFVFQKEESSSVTLPQLGPAEESKYAELIRAQWRAAVKASPQHIVTFPNDPYLLGFRIMREGTSDYDYYVVDIRKPILVDITKAETPLAEGKRLTLDLEVPEKSYQLTVHLRHTDNLETLDLEQLVQDSFRQIITAKGDD